MLQGKRICLLAGIIMQFAIADSFSQGTVDSLRIDSVSIGYPQCPDTAFEGQNYSNFVVVVRNIGTDSIAAPIAILLKAQDSISVADTLIGFTGQTYTIVPGTAINIFQNGNYDFNPANYRTGSNVVVVWPVVNGVTIFIDSLTIPCVNFFPFTGLPELDLNNAISVYPNPAEEYLTLKYPDQIFIESVRIFDVSARLVLAPLWNDAEKIKINALVPGIYILELTTKEKGKVRKQFVKR